MANEVSVSFALFLTSGELTTRGIAKVGFSVYNLGMNDP